MLRPRVRLLLTVLAMLLTGPLAGAAQDYQFPLSSRWYRDVPHVSYLSADGVPRSELDENSVLEIVPISLPNLPEFIRSVAVYEFHPGGPETSSVEGRSTIAFFIWAPGEPFWLEASRFKLDNSAWQAESGGARRMALQGASNALGFVVALDGVRYQQVPDNVGYDPNDPEIIEAASVDEFRDNYAGFDIVKLSPWDFRTGEGRRRDVFKRQPYRRGVGGDAIPVGLDYLNLGCSSNGSRQCLLVETSAQYMTKLNNRVDVSAGVNLSTAIPFSGEFGANRDVTEALTDLSSGSAYYCIQYATGAHHVYSLDRRDAALSDEFVRDVLALAESGGADWNALTGFIQKYGTHYAASIVYGGKAEDQLRIDTETQQALAEMERCLGGKASFSTIVSAAANGQQCNAESFDLTTKLEEENSNWRNIGATGGADGQSFSCSPNPRDHAPIFMELRPISELLLPPFLTGQSWAARVLALTLAPMLKTAIDTWIRGAAEGTAALINDRSAASQFVPTSSGCQPKQGSLSLSNGMVAEYILPQAVVGEQHTYFPFLPNYGDTQKARIVARCTAAAGGGWSVGETMGPIGPELGSPHCAATKNQPPCFKLRQ